jgi:hypothetical protein
MRDVRGLDQVDFLLCDQLGCADVEVIAAAAGAEFERPAGAVLAEFEPEAGLFELRQQRRVEPFHLVGDLLVRDAYHRKRHAGIEEGRKLPGQAANRFRQ